MIVDLHNVLGVGTAGPVGLYAMVRLAHGAPSPDPEAGCAAIRALAEDYPSMARLAVVNPHPPIRETLARAPFSDFLAIHTDLDVALAALGV